MASLSTATDGQITEFKNRLSRAGFTAEIIREVNASDENELAKVMFDALMCHRAPTLINDYFVSPEAQIARVRERNQRFGWGISDEAFAEAEKSVPAWPEGRLVAVALVPYLTDKVNEDGTIMTGLERTFHELWVCAKAEQDASWRWDGYDKAGSDRLRLHKGIEHPSTSSGKAILRWEVIDLGSNRNRKPKDVRSAKSSPHAGILAAAALHPNWVKSMDGDKVPYVWLPGYEAQVPGGRPWTDVPHLGFLRDDRGIRLDCIWCGYGYSGWAVPSFIRE